MRIGLAICAVVVSGVALAMVTTTVVGVVDTRRPILQMTDGGRLDTRAPGFIILFR